MDIPNLKKFCEMSCSDEIIAIVDDIQNKQILEMKSAYHFLQKNEDILCKKVKRFINGTIGQADITFVQLE